MGDYYMMPCIAMQMGELWGMWCENPGVWHVLCQTISYEKFVTLHDDVIE